MPAAYLQVVVGRGLRISLPVSSQDILKSTSTALVLEVMMEGDTTFLCIPKMNRMISDEAAKVKKRWLRRDWTKVASCVLGSVSHM